MTEPFILFLDFVNFFWYFYNRLNIVLLIWPSFEPFPKRIKILGQFENSLSKLWNLFLNISNFNRFNLKGFPGASLRLSNNFIFQADWHVPVLLENVFRLDVRYHQTESLEICIEMINAKLCKSEVVCWLLESFWNFEHLNLVGEISNLF